MLSLPLYIYFIAISFLVSLTVYLNRRQTPLYLLLFPPFLITTLTVEIIGARLSDRQQPNVWLYNFFTVFEFCFYLLLVSFIIGNHKMKLVLRYTLLLYAMAASGNIIFIQRIGAFHTVTYSIGCLLIVAACVYYFFELFKIPQAIKLKNTPAFWICSGLLFFYSCGYPLFAVTNFFAAPTNVFIQNYNSISSLLNILLYSSFIIASLCRIRTRKFSS